MDHPEEIKQLIAQCELGVPWFNNDQVSAALHYAQTLAKRIAELEATLPKTVDGVPIHYGMRVWVDSDHADRAGWCTVKDMRPAMQGDPWLLIGGMFDFYSDECYSSPEAEQETYDKRSH